MSANLQIFCANATTESELALEINMNLQALANATFNNFIIRAQVSSEKIANSQVVTDIVGMNYHDLDSLMTALFTMFVNDFNLTHSTGIDLKEKVPVLKFVAGMLQATLLTPYQE